MFDIGWQELLLIIVVALISLGPKDLPRAMFSLGRWVRKAKAFSLSMRGYIDRVLNEAEMEEIRRKIEEEHAKAQGSKNNEL